MLVQANLNQAAPTELEQGVVRLEGARVTSEQGLAVVAGNHVEADTAVDSRERSSYNLETRTRVGHWHMLGQSKTQTDTVEGSRTVQGSVIQGGAGTAVLATGVLAARAAQLGAPDSSLQLKGGVVHLDTDYDSAHASTSRKTKKNEFNFIATHQGGRWLGHKGEQKQEGVSTTLVPTVLAGSAIGLTSTAGGVNLRAVRVQEASTPVQIDAAGGLQAEVAQTVKSTSSSNQGGDLAWTYNRGEGQVDQTTHYNQLGSQVHIKAPTITADMGVKDSAQVLAQQPGLIPTTQSGALTLNETPPSYAH